LLPRFREAYRELATLEARESWSRAEIEAFQLERLNKVWQHAVVHVPYYRDLRARVALPDRFASTAEFRELVPVLPKALVRTQRLTFLSEKAEAGHWDFSSGSTGTPTQFYWGQVAQREMLRAKYRFLATWGIDIFDRFAFLWGLSAAFQSGWSGWLARIRQPLIDWFRNRIRLPAYQLGHDDLRGYLRRLAAFRPTALYAYASAAYLLAQEAAVAGVRLPSLKAVILSAEPVFPQIVRTVEQAFGIPALIEYGSVESVLMAAEAPDRTLRVRQDTVLLETAPRSDGYFDILLTVLNNPSFPLLRYALGDTTDTPLHVPERGFAILKSLVGRKNDLIVTRTGRYLHPIWFDEIFSRNPIVRGWQIHQHKDGSLSIQVELKSPDTVLDTPALTRTIQEKIENYPVHLEVVSELARTAAGKHRWIRSELSDPAADQVSR